MASIWHFAVFILVSLVAFVGVLLVVLNRRRSPPTLARVLGVASVVVSWGHGFRQSRNERRATGVAILRDASSAHLGAAAHSVSDAGQ